MTSRYVWLAFCAIGALALGGCAKSSNQAAAAPVSSLQYQNYTCSQIKAELTSLNGRLIQGMRRQDDAASSDAAVTAVGAVLFWPALFFIDGDDEGTYQLAQMKGEFNALEKAAVQRNCDVAAEIQESRRAQDSYQQRRNQNYQ